MLLSYTQIGKNHLHFETMESTNDYAYNLVSKSNPLDGTVISTDFQTNGHGQFDRKWESNAGENILLTIILYPGFLSVEKQFFLSFSISLSIIKYLNEKKIDAKIKWPNDIYFESKKIAGILIKNTISCSKLSSSIVGIGLNLNQEFFSSNEHATSIKKISTNSRVVKTEIQALLKCVEVEYNSLKSLNEQNLIKKYESYLYYINESIQFEKDGTSSKLEIIGTDFYGRLITRDEEGVIIKITHGVGKIHYPSNK